MKSQQQHKLSFRQWMEAYYIASIPTILTMENFRITTAVASMLKQIAKSQRPPIPPDIMLEQLVEEAYRQKFRR